MDADMDKVRRIMLEQQAVFQEQLQELHRVYRVQKALMLKPREQRAFELAVFPVKTEPNVSPGPAPPPRRRRTFDLERPAEEYMDVDGELDEPRITTANNTNSNSRDLAYQLNGTVSVPSLDSSALPRAVLESSGLLNGRVLGRSEKEAEFLHMLKRANSSDEAPEMKRGVGGGGFGFMGALSSSWYGSVENGSTEKHNTSNGFHFGRGAVEDKGSKSHLQSELLPLHSKQSEASNQLLQIQQHAVFLDSGLSSGFNPALNTGLNRLASGSASCSVSSTGVDPAFNLNPFLSGGVSDENAKYNNRLQNHVSYSNQGILIPCSSASSTSGTVRRDPVLDGLWWKTFPNQSVVPPVVGSVPTSWPGGYISNHSAPSFHHSPILGMPGGFKDDNASGWLRGNNHTNNAGSGCGSTPGFHFSASTPPKPPFKKPPKLILDGATNELRQVDGSRPAPGAVRHPPDSLVAEEIAGVGERNSVDGGCFVDGGRVAEIPKPLETDLNLVPVSVSSDKSSSEKQSGVVLLPEAKSLEIQKAQEQGVVAEIVQETGLGAGLVESCLSEANLGRSEDPLTCSCALPGCRVCGKGSVEDGQMQTSWKHGVESSAPPREEVRENGEPPPPSGKKRKFKLLLATRESESGNRKKAEGEILASRAAEPESSKPEHGGGEGERKKRKSSLLNSTSNNNNNSKRSSGHHHHEPSKESKMSPVSRHTKEKPHNGYSAMDNSDDGANLAAEILVSLAPRSAAPPPPVDKNSNSSSRAHHKSRRRSIDTLPTGVTSNRPVSPSPKSSVEPKDGKKKKKKKSGKSKSPIDEDPPKPSASVKHPVKLGQTNPVSDYPESVTERSSSKHKKKLVSKKQQLQQQQVQNHSSPIPRMSKPSSSGAGNPSKTTLNVVHSKTRDGVQHHHKSNNHHHHGNEKKRSHNNSSEHESVDHQQAVHHSGGNSSDDITEKGSEVEHEDSSWSRRSWGASARRKRMRRCKRSDL